MSGTEKKRSKKKKKVLATGNLPPTSGPSSPTSPKSLFSLSLSSIPPYLLVRICFFLDTFTLFCFSCTSRTFRKLTLEPPLQRMRNPSLKEDLLQIAQLVDERRQWAESIKVSEACDELLKHVSAKTDPLFIKTQSFWKSKSTSNTSSVQQTSTTATGAPNLKVSKRKEDKRAKELDKLFNEQLRMDALRFRRSFFPFKALLLGLPNSGKTTWLKQMELTYGQNHPEKLLNVAPLEALKMHFLDTMKDFLGALEIADDDFKKEIDEFISTTEWCPTTTMAKIRNFWKHDYLQPLFKANSFLPLLNIDHYLSNPSFELTDNLTLQTQDFLNVKGKTVLGISELTVTVKRQSVTFYEHNEESISDRRGKGKGGEMWDGMRFLKKATHFDHATHVFYFVSLEGYDIPLLDEPQVTQLDRAFEIWANLSRSLDQQELILLLTKTDIFRRKVRKNPPSNTLLFFREMYAEPTCDNVLEYILSRFQSERRSFHYSVCCLDESACSQLMSVILDRYIEWNFLFF